MEEIINSVMQSPENTNPNVLRSQLQSVGGGSGGGVMVVDCTMNGTTITSTKTAGEIFEAIEGKTVVFKLLVGGITAYLFLISASNKSGYVFYLAQGKNADGTLLSMELRADSADDYPATNPK